MQVLYLALLVRLADLNGLATCRPQSDFDFVRAPPAPTVKPLLS